MDSKSPTSRAGRLVDSIKAAVSFRTDATGETLVKKVKGSSITLPELDEAKINKNAESLVRSLLEEESPAKVLVRLKGAVSQAKSLFTRTHDGFRVAKGSGKRKMTISDLYAFSVAAGYCFDFLPPSGQRGDVRIGIGVMAPAVQDCGKNLIKLVWKVAGYTVTDLGTSVQPKSWLHEISSGDLSVVAVSCMTNKCLENLGWLVQGIAAGGSSLPVIIGGIAVNRMAAYDLEQRYGVAVYYGQDLSDAESVLEKALRKAPLEIPLFKAVEEIRLPAQTSSLLRNSFRIFRISLTDIVINDRARAGCDSCSGDKRKICPLQVGYEKQKSIEESTALVNSHKFAVLVSADLPDESDRPGCKLIWEDRSRSNATSRDLQRRSGLQVPDDLPVLPAQGVQDLQRGVHLPFPLPPTARELEHQHPRDRGEGVR